MVLVVLVVFVVPVVLVVITGCFFKKKAPLFFFATNANPPKFMGFRIIWKICHNSEPSY